jgi:hypothetical protein
LLGTGVAVLEANRALARIDGARTPFSTSFGHTAVFLADAGVASVATILAAFLPHGAHAPRSSFARARQVSKQCSKLSSLANAKAKPRCRTRSGALAAQRDGG